MNEFLALNKVLPALILPTGLTLWFCGYGLYSRKRWPVAVAVTILAIASCPAVANQLLRTLENPYDVDVPSETFDAVYVLGGYLENWHGRIRGPQWSEAGDRLELGIRMAREGRAKVLVISSGGLDSSHGVRSRVIAIERGLPVEQLIVTRPVSNTADESAAIAALVAQHRWRRVALVTSAFHMRRALFQMDAAGASVIPVATDFHSGTSTSRQLQHFVPSGKGLYWSELALREWMGIGFYSLKAALW